MKTRKHGHRMAWLHGSLLPLLALLLAGIGQAVADAPNFQSGYGIAVQGSRWVSSRTLEVDIATDVIAPQAINGRHQVRITLPTDYFANPGLRYPVLYLLHGGAGGHSSQWTAGGGAVEPLTAGKRLITVMPDGGKVGWYTNWVNTSAGAQSWEHFHLYQLLPWVDANLRTLASKQGRAIAGLSMGGFGAIHYAQQRPDLFAYAASFSGALDLGNAGIRSVVTEQAAQNLLPIDGPFGPPVWPLDTVWNEKNPITRADRLRNVQVALYAGSGIHDADVLERTVGWSTHLMHEALDNAGIPHFYWMYGRPGPSAPFGCDGGHNFGCWNFALNDALPKMLNVLGQPGQQPPAGNAVSNAGFEAGSNSPWACLGQCGVDRGLGFAKSGGNNGWVRNNRAGWNDIHQTVAVTPNTSYRLTGWVRTSANNTDGYFGVRAANGAVVGEKKFARQDGYTQLSVVLNSGNNSSLVVFGGVWTSQGDVWMQIDDVALTPVN